MSNTRLGLVRCEHCGRQFNAHSAARHIPWCAKQRADASKHKVSLEKRQALERYKWRISYRPSNQIQATGNARHQASQLSNLKQSSINSSATLSSPSAGSTTSIGTSVTSSNNGARQRHQHRNQPATPAAKQSPSVSQLKKSISSLTLTKQPKGATSNSQWRESSGRDSVQSTATFTRLDKPRTKSVSDLSSMNLIVESLAKRVEEIYAQNQLLLMSLSRANLTAVAGQVQSEEEEGDSDNADSLVRCNDCKANCYRQANYCHKCGSKVRD